jgi:hypothetical protein
MGLEEGGEDGGGGAPDDSDDDDRDKIETDSMIKKVRVLRIRLTSICQ